MVFPRKHKKIQYTLSTLCADEEVIVTHPIELFGWDANARQIVNHGDVDGEVTRQRRRHLNLCTPTTPPSAVFQASFSSRGGRQVQSSQGQFEFETTRQSPRPKLERWRQNHERKPPAAAAAAVLSAASIPPPAATATTTTAKLLWRISEPQQLSNAIPQSASTARLWIRPTAPAPSFLFIFAQKPTRENRSIGKRVEERRILRRLQ